ncbi:MAG: hypothetical protein C0613_06880 [Desulfobulbaceae bacterium]|nr:MAG: hypothetical protein C0613_06880 [Desulfobulbaceae bacterium]
MLDKIGWGLKKGKWLAAIVVLAAIFPMTGAVVATVLLVFFVLVRSSDIYRQALFVIRHDPAVVSQLGAPIRPGLFVQGNVIRKSSITMVTLAIPLTGASAKATAFVVGHRHGVHWSLADLQVCCRPSGVCLKPLKKRSSS